MHGIKAQTVDTDHKNVRTEPAAGQHKEGFRNQKENSEEENEEDESDRNMAATIAVEEVFAVPNELIANEIVGVAGDVVEELLGEGLIEVIGDGVVDQSSVVDVFGESIVELLDELGIIELLVGESLNHIAGNLSGTLVGLTYSAYKCGAYLAPTLRSLFTLLLRMAGGLGGSYVMRSIGGYVGGIGGEFHESIGSEFGELIGSMFSGATGAFCGRYSAIRLALQIINTYWSPVKVLESTSKVKVKVKEKQS